MVKLSSSLKFSEQTKSIKLPNANEHFNDGSLCFISGWGDTLDANIPSDYLRGIFSKMFIFSFGNENKLNFIFFNVQLH